MNDKVNLIDDDIPAHKKKSKNKGLPRSKHKHIYETVLLTRDYHTIDYKTGKPKVTQTILPTKVCTICGRIDETDNDLSYYIKKPVPNLPFLAFKKILSEKALSLPKWYAENFWDKFAVKMEEEDDEEVSRHNSCSGCVYEDADGSTEDIGNCVCCSRMVDTAKNDYYRKR